MAWPKRERKKKFLVQWFSPSFIPDMHFPSYKVAEIHATEFIFPLLALWGFPSGPLVKNLPASQETWVQFLVQEDRSSGEGNDNPLQYSCLGNPMDRGAWQARVHGVTKTGSDTTED